MKRVLTGILLLCGLLTSPLAGAANPPLNILQWGRWSFDYEVRDNTGLALRNVTCDGELVLGKASMPVLRVKYVKERIWWNPFTWFGSRADSGRCGHSRIDCVGRTWSPSSTVATIQSVFESSTLNGTKWLELGIYARIGKYHIYQSWHLSDDGELRPIVQSRGLSCNTDHITTLLAL